MTQITCPSCHADVLATHRFCSSCGKPTTRSARVPLIPVLILAAALFGLGYAGQSYLGGEAPTLSQSEHAMQSYTDPNLERLRAAVKSEPGNLGHIRALAEALGRKITELEEPPTELVFEIIQSLGQILQREPEDRQALISMANISFNQRAFDKAAEYYDRYLKLVPDDTDARSNRASALGFLGEHERAISELDAVLAKEPNNFQAIAFKAVTYAGMGNYAQATAIGKQALKIAPNDEARARLQDFLDKVTAAPSAPTSEAVPAGSSASATSGASVGVPALTAKLKAHPIAGAKFSRIEERRDALRLLFNDFPMASMPPFMRDKFLKTVQGYAADAGLASHKLQFVDERSGEVMAEGGISAK